MAVLALIFAVFALVGVAQLVYGARLVQDFCAKSHHQRPAIKPGVTILKPLCGVEPLSELALESFFVLDYPQYQLVFGVQNPKDPVLEIITHLRARYPHCDVALMVNDTPHGRNQKVANLMNMRPLAKYEILVVADADIHAPPYYLDDVVASLEQPQVGLVTSLYTGLPSTPTLAARLGAAQINQTFLPSALLGRRLGRQDCMGATMAITKTMLAQIGGFEALVNHLADDQVLGRLVVKAGYKVGLAQMVPSTTVPEADFTSLYQHELRWARTIRALVPLAYIGSVLQIPLLWAVLAMLATGFGWWSLLLFVGVWAARCVTTWQIEAALRLPRTRAVWLFLLRDVFSAIIYGASFMGSRVAWRGQSLMADSGRPVPG